jgi:hypothetical protein
MKSDSKQDRNVQGGGNHDPNEQCSVLVLGLRRSLVGDHSRGVAGRFHGTDQGRGVGGTGDRRLLGA